jgi:rubrerythrin
MQDSASLNIDSTRDLLAQALALETEASERYAELAEQMRTHNNSDVAEFFDEMSRIEKLHMNNVLALAQSFDIPDISSAAFRWTQPEGPETTDLGNVHYLMTPHHALQLALHNEKLAHVFFAEIAAGAADADVVLLASEMAEEEQEHVALMEKWLGRYPAPSDDWSDDPDPPAARD